ncbi:hypothetical protein Q760_00080 [Cellulomonas cellasea DSM 20118]|uniref:Uncharacterized protein n=1 Tax=Cellulomonas cellasea DSM 20118 TaxID=1408250 RepID=A0A0A0BCV8_9CELL|nr:hypothetical protein Q760_00080 [Cellulomonas cellasea DSM 20118]
MMATAPVVLGTMTASATDDAADHVIRQGVRVEG